MTSLRRIAFLSVSLLAIAHPSGAQGRALAIEDYYRVKTVGAPQMSPDGRWVAYTVSTRIDTPNELDYYRHGGILQYVLRQLAKG